MILNFTTNAACPQRPAWHINEVGYEWARVVFRDYISKRKENSNKNVRLLTNDNHDEDSLFLLGVCHK